jgi:ankyrin repeat protein
MSLDKQLERRYCELIIHCHCVYLIFVRALLGADDSEINFQNKEGDTPLDSAENQIQHQKWLLKFQREDRPWTLQRPKDVLESGDCPSST